MSQNKERSAIEQFLSLFTDVKSGEGITMLFMMVNVFLLLTAYYILKTVREPLILLGGMGDLKGEELKIYASAGQAFLLLGVVPAYGWLASKVNRIRLLNITMLIFMGCLGLFYVLAKLELPLGLVFYLWLGIFNVFVIAQFWSYANDIYTDNQGKRLFAVIAVGGSVGASVGPLIAGNVPISPYELMLVASAILGVCLVIYNIVNSREAAQAKALAEEEAADGGKQVEEPLSKDGGFQLVLRERYLLLIALMLLVANLVNTTGEFILASTANEHAAELVPASQFPELANDEEALKKALGEKRGPIISKFYGDFYGIVNIVSLLIQAFLVSRIFKYVGVRIALFILPIIAFGGYALIGLVGGLTLIRVAKIAENSTDYSLQNTVRQALFLPTSREAKYKAKAAIDTFFVRTGDALSAGLVALGIHVLLFSKEHFAFVNVGLIVIWLFICAAIARHHRKLSPDARIENT